MKNKPLSKKMKAQLVEEVSRQIVSDSYHLAELDLSEMALTLYQDMFGKNAIAFDALPEAIVPSVGALPLTITVGEKTINREVRVSRVIRYAEGMGDLIVPKECTEEVVECLKIMKAESSANSSILDKVSASLDLISGTTRLCAVWPEMTPIVARLFMSREDQRSGVPEEVLIAKDAITEFLKPAPPAETTKENLEEAEEMAEAEKAGENGEQEEITKT